MHRVVCLCDMVQVAGVLYNALRYIYEKKAIVYQNTDDPCKNGDVP